MCFCLLTAISAWQALHQTVVSQSALHPQPCLFCNWRSAPCGMHSVLQSVSWSAFSPFVMVTLLCQPLLPQRTSALTVSLVILAPAVCSKIIHFILYVFPYFSAPRCLPVLRRASVYLLCATLYRTVLPLTVNFWDLLNACCSLRSMEWEKYICRVCCRRKFVCFYEIFFL
jgi:hypothetical protein